MSGADAWGVPIFGMGTLYLLALLAKLVTDLKVESVDIRRRLQVKDNLDIFWRSSDASTLPFELRGVRFEPTEAITDWEDLTGSRRTILALFDTETEGSWWLGRQWATLPPEQAPGFPASAIVLFGTPRRIQSFMRYTHLRHRNLVLVDRQSDLLRGLRLVTTPAVVAVEGSRLLASAYVPSIGHVIQFAGAAFAPGSAQSGHDRPQVPQEVAP